METTRPQLVGDFGMAASTHWIASSVAMSMLELGGNAADAAVAGGFALQIVEPHLNGAGGDAPIMVSTPAGVEVICGQGVAPAAANIAAMRQLGVTAIPGTGLLPAVVPGAFDAWLTLLQRHGTMNLREVLEPAITLAERGHPLLPRAAAAIASVADLFRKSWPTSAEQWLPGGVIPLAGERIMNPVLAATYRRILAESGAAGSDRDAQIDAARDAWYRGFVAEEIGQFCAATVVPDAEGRHHRSLLTADDLSAWHATVERPLSVRFGDHDVFKAGPWSQGPVLLQQLTILDTLGIQDAEIGGTEWVHLIVEASKLAFADREAWYGDPQFADVPVETLLSKEYAIERMGLVSSKASLGLRPGRPDGREPVVAPLIEPASELSAPGIGEPTVTRNGESRGDTCHIDVVDSTGMMISATPSGGWLQSSPHIPALGFCLGTRGQMFSMVEGTANMLRPGSRPRTTLSPSISYRHGDPHLAFGTPGGDSQDQWSLQLFLRVASGESNLQRAIDAPAFHSNHAPDSFYPKYWRPGELVVEDRLGQGTINGLRARGHRVVVSGGWSEGRLSAVARDGGWLKAAANPRGSQGYAVGR